VEYPVTFGRDTSKRADIVVMDADRPTVPYLIVVLLAYLRLPPVCELMDLHTSASLYPAIAEANLLALPFPRIDASVQTRIVANVRAAQASRQRAADLLDAAKRAVEIAIEDSEAAALKRLASFKLSTSTAP